MDREPAITGRPDSAHEKARISALNRYKIAGTHSEEIFDHYGQVLVIGCCDNV